MPSPLPAIVPRPRRIAAADGACALRLRELRVHPQAAAYAPLALLAREMGLRLRADATLPPSTAIGGDAAAPEAPAQSEGYGLRIASGGIALRGADLRGLVWGLHTLRQVLTQAPRPPCLEISDWPEYGIRYHHDDVSRKQVSTAAGFRRILDRLASFKVSHYTVYLEDMLRIDGIPLMGENRGAFTPESLRALVVDGARRQIEVFPTLSLAGHQENLMRLPRYRGLGARTWQPPSSFDPRNPAVREHLLRVLDAACPLFDSPFFHMGFDEVQGLDADGFVDHLNWCCERLVERGKTPLFWADMLYNHFGCDALQRIHPAAVPVAWDYGRTGGKARAAVPDMLRHRERVWILAGYNNWSSFQHAPMAEALEQWTNWRAIADPARVAAFGASQWGDEGYENSRELCWPLFAACAEQGWSGGDGDPASVEARFHCVFHGHPLPALARLRRLLESGLAISGRRAWSLHRLPAPGWVREAKAGRLPTAARLAADARALAGARRELAAIRRQAVCERDHLDHLLVSIERHASLIARAQAARRPAAIPAARTAVARARAAFRSAWLACNQAENIEVALSVFDAQDAS